MSSRFSARVLHRVAAGQRHAEALIWSSRTSVLPNRDPAVLIKRRGLLQDQFIMLAEAVSLCGADAATLAKTESIRAELACIERDLAMAQSDSAA